MKNNFAWFLLILLLLSLSLADVSVPTPNAFDIVGPYTHTGLACIKAMGYDLVIVRAYSLRSGG